MDTIIEMIHIMVSLVALKTILGYGEYNFLKRIKHGKKYTEFYKKTISELKKY